MKLQILTPDKAVFDGEVQSILVPAVAEERQEHESGHVETGDTGADDTERPDRRLARAVRTFEHLVLREESRCTGERDDREPTRHEHRHGPRDLAREPPHLRDVGAIP